MADPTQSGTDPYGSHLRRVVDLSRRMREALINGSVYIDEINRERDRYVAGLISVEELEVRIAQTLNERDGCP